MTKESAEFVIYIINFLAHSLKKYPSEIYKVLESTNCIKEYLVPFYDVLQLSKKNNVSLEKAMQIYYQSKLANLIHSGEFGVQYLDSAVLVELLEKEN